MILGKNIETGEDVILDLKRLIRTRLLIQANSGGGKSWCARRIMEQTHKDVQHIIIDTEGEFSTLRERHDYMLVGSDGEIPATIKTAELLPKKIMGMKLSVIIDLSEMSKSEKCNYIKKFVESLLRLPREYWTPLLVFIDEAHDFAPEASAGKAESKPAIISLGSKGRKRRWAVILMTQRSAKLSNDASAECNNKLTGLANIPTDRKKASDDLGFTTKEEARRLRDLEPGEMYGYGSAISRQVVKIKIGPVFTTHEEDEDGEMTKPSKTPENIKKLLSKFIDLPKEAEKELREKEDFVAKIHELKTKVRVLEHSKLKPEVDHEKMGVMVDRARREGEAAALKAYSTIEIRLKENIQIMEKERKDMSATYERIIKEYQRKGAKVIELFGGKSEELPEWKMEAPKLSFESIKAVPHIKPQHHIKPQYPASYPEPIPHPIQDTQPIDYDGEIKLTPAYNRILRTNAMFYPEEISKAKLSILSDIPQKASTFRNGLSKLKTMGLITVSNGSTRCTEKGLEIVGDVPEIPIDSESRVNMWCTKLSPAYERMFRFIVENYPNEISKEDLSTGSDVPVDASTFRNGLSKIKTLGLIKVESGIISASPELFE